MCACNLSPVPRDGYRLGLPRGGTWRELANTDADALRRLAARSTRPVVAEDTCPGTSQPVSASLTLPPLGVVWLAPEGQ